ncbi:MAG: hypothetical protein AB7P02_06095 [Alphaproteobacteria bacterium]
MSTRFPSIFALAVPVLTSAPAAANPVADAASVIAIGMPAVDAGGAAAMGALALAVLAAAVLTAHLGRR